MPKNVNIMKVYDKILAIKEMLSEAVNVAMETANEAESFGGEVSRVLTSQLRQQLIPNIQNFIDDKNNPASVSSLINFLDRVPLAWIRSGQEEPNQQAPMADMMEQPNQQVGLAPTAAPNAGTAPAQIPPGTVPEAEQPMKMAASTILKDKNKLRETVINDWTTAHSQPQTSGLNFKALQEDYKRLPPIVPGMISGALEQESRVFSEVLKEATAPTKTRLEEKDIVCGPYAVREDVGGMDDWKKMVADDTELEFNESAINVEEPDMAGHIVN